MHRILTGSMTMLAVVLGSWTGAAQAQQQQAQQQQGQQQVDRPLDKQFLIKAISANQAEIKVSQQVESQTNNNKVKGFAQQMSKDHSNLQQKLADAAKNEKVAVLTGNEQHTKNMLDQLSKLRGADLDRAYLNTMIKEHEKAIQMFEWQAQQGKDADLNALAKSALPELREHLTEARKLATTIDNK